MLALDVPGAMIILPGIEHPGQQVVSQAVELRAALYARTDEQPIAGRRHLVVLHCRGRRIEYLFDGWYGRPRRRGHSCRWRRASSCRRRCRTGSAEPQHPSRGRLPAPIARASQSSGRGVHHNDRVAIFGVIRSYGKIARLKVGCGLPTGAKTSPVLGSSE